MEGEDIETASTTEGAAVGVMAEGTTTEEGTDAEEATATMTAVTVDIPAEMTTQGAMTDTAEDVMIAVEAEAEDMEATTAHPEEAVVIAMAAVMAAAMLATATQQHLLPILLPVLTTTTGTPVVRN